MSSGREPNELTQEEIDHYKAAWPLLTADQQNICRLIAHGYTAAEIFEFHYTLKRSSVYERIDAAKAILKCTFDEIPKAVFAAQGLLNAYSWADHSDPLDRSKARKRRRRPRKAPGGKYMATPASIGY